MSCHPQHVDPAVAQLFDMGNDDEGAVAAAEKERERHTGDDDPFDKTYLAIDGVTADEISDEDVEQLERAVVELMLKRGYSVSGARVISTEKNVIELDQEE